jgi:hypothetical protein
LGHITPEYVLFPDPRLYLATLKQASSPLSLSLPPSCFPYSIELTQEDPKVPAYLDVLGSRCCRCRRSLPLLDTHLQGAYRRGSHPYTLFHLRSPFVPDADLLVVTWFSTTSCTRFLSSTFTSRVSLADPTRFSALAVFSFSPHAQEHRLEPDRRSFFLSIS